MLSFSQLALPLISIPYVSRVLDPAGIGRVSFIDSFTYYFITIAGFGISVYGMREVSRVKDDAGKLSRVVSELLALHCIATAAALVMYTVSAMLLWDEIRDPRLVYFSVSFLLVNSIACEWYFIGRERFKYIALRSLFIRFTGLSCIFIFIKQPEDFYIYYAIMASSAIANSVWNNIILFREVKISFRSLDLRRHIQFTWVTYLISLLYSVSLLLDNVLLGIVSTATAVGYYAFAMRMSKTSMVLLTDALLVFFPRMVSYIKSENHAMINSTILRSIQLMTIFSIPITFGLFFLADELILLFLGPKFESAVINLKILSIFPLLRSYNLFLAKQVLIPNNQEKRHLKVLAIGNAFFIVLTLGLSSRFDDTGACVAILIAEALMVVLNLQGSRKTSPSLKLIDERTTLHAFVSAFVFVPVIITARFLFSDMLSIVVFSIVLCVLLYFFLLAFVLRNGFAVAARDNVWRFLKTSLK